MNYLTMEQIRSKVKQITLKQADYEMAHGLEDELRAEFIQHVRNHPDDPDLGYKAQLVLATKTLDFPRYCA